MNLQGVCKLSKSDNENINMTLTREKYKDNIAKNSNKMVLLAKDRLILTLFGRHD
jgi:tryptophanyl-tRNA synthetase